MNRSEIEVTVVDIHSVITRLMKESDIRLLIIEKNYIQIDCTEIGEKQMIEWFGYPVIDDSSYEYQLEYRWAVKGVEFIWLKDN